ncbi:WD40 repeat domain-containing protein [Streptomyces sp. NPDC046859]|uniref:WD40 repeat domain-containing protein n=1 Tax=Streptomyces sp. NPDC046859 TaxID=3155734 RepID=UPI0033F804D0
MNVEELVRQSLREQAGEQPPVDAGFADRVLAVRRRRRTRRIASVAAATAAVVGIAVAVPLLGTGEDDARPAAGLRTDGVQAHPDQSPPRDVIGAGETVLAAHYTSALRVRSEKRGTVERTYWLLDAKTGTYKRDSRWSFVAVAPGLRTAAVLERGLPAHRIGLLDLASGRVERWIPVQHGVGGVAFGHDGSKLVATTYGEDPDLRTREKTDGPDGRPVWQWNSAYGRSSRSGFYVLDVAHGTGPWRAVPPEADIKARQDFAFSRAGDRVYAQYIEGRDGLQQFYSLDGARTAAPAEEKHLRSDVPARLSPDGRLAALGLSKEVDGDPGRSYSSIRDPRTGEEITEVRGAELLAWADGKRLIAWERVTGLDEPYRPRLVLVTLGSDEVVPLSGVREPDKDIQRQNWEPVFARR